MGCTNSTKKQESEVDGRKPNENGFKNLFYATTEFDISATESENEDELFSIKSTNKNNNNTKQKLTKNMSGISSGLTTTNNNPSSTTSALLDNRLNQTCV
jgi:hypothetical protein